jgi:hypothetical protein
MSTQDLGPVPTEVPAEPEVEVAEPVIEPVVEVVEPVTEPPVPEVPAVAASLHGPDNDGNPCSCCVVE